LDALVKAIQTAKTVAQSTHQAETTTVSGQ
jgi:hypothetical protein